MITNTILLILLLVDILIGIITIIKSKTKKQYQSIIDMQNQTIDNYKETCDKFVKKIESKILNIKWPDYINISKQELELCNASDKPEQTLLNLVIQRLVCHFDQRDNNGENK